MTRRPHGLRPLVHSIGGGVIAVATCANAPLAYADEVSPQTRVRSDHPTIARLIAQATQQSVTFRREVEAINLSDGLVYVQEGHCGRGVHACLAMTVELAGPSRLLRVKLDLSRSELDTMVAIGHELRHAIEVLSDPQVTDSVRIVSFYQRLAPTGNDRFETAAAVRAGEDIFEELRVRAIGPSPDVARPQTTGARQR